MTLGELAYSAYCDAREWKSVAGQALPKFAEQSPPLKEAWEIAANAVAEHVRSETAPGETV